METSPSSVLLVSDLSQGISNNMSKGQDLYSMSAKKNVDNSLVFVTSVVIKQHLCQNENKGFVNPDDG